jgi:hypothetical protein
LAIEMLKKIIGGGAHRIVDADEKACIYISIAEYSFDDEDLGNAETYINKAAEII